MSDGFLGRSARRIVSVWEGLRDRVRGKVPWLGELLDHLARIRVMDSATVLAAKVFMTVMPLLFVVCAFMPDPVRGWMRDSLREVLGLGAGDQVDALFAAPGSAATQAFGLLAVLVVVLSATDCSRSLQRLCEQCWHLPQATSAFVVWRWLVWLGVLLLSLLVGATVRHELSARVVIGVAAALLGNTLLWWWTQHLLLAGRVRWPALLPGALLAGLGLTCVLTASRLYMPDALDHSTALYGSLGPVFTVLGWLIAVCFVLTAGLAAGPVIARRSPVRGWLDDTGPDVTE
ncbi:YhjD/YihY/BrkB family envelope integrity protein [Actinomadura macrotermitis]|uniref:Uncharacterized protein n=1 Tax=Actinomadura macrotermitis TaxID=2585200 RepID=A0A7K0BTX1_9ACTN|nr:YhjD/YihY/BrkB family envelope integrity protein [Actinomadura macrotermitis]MQY04352.1 hypothetical protein [Actinomadura macrotermitis]